MVDFADIFEYGFYEGFSFVNGFNDFAYVFFGFVLKQCFLKLDLD